MKKIRLTIEDIFEIPTAVIYNPDQFKFLESVSIDSRNISRKGLFVAIKGEKFDGHDFVSYAIENGAEAVLFSEEKYENFKELNIPFITVKDTLKALGDIAKIWRKKLNTKIIGITGSTGKSTTKEMLALILNEKFKVNKTIGNNNNHIGVPLTIFSTNNSHGFLVAELGTNHFGEIKYTSEILEPDYALITNIGHSHLEFLKNKRGILKEKIELFRTTSERKGFIFINNDDPLLSGISKNYKNKLTFGFKSKSDVKGKITGYTDEGKPVIQINYKNKRLKETFSLYGEQSAKNFLAASAVAFKLGLNTKQISSAVKKIKSVDKRLNVRKYPGFLLIDDTYNANPDSMKFAVELLSRIKNYKKKIAVLGDMFELGEEGPAQHKKLAAVINKNKIDAVFTIGPLMKNLNEGLNKVKIETEHFTEREQFKKFLKEKRFDDSVVLVKGSRGMKMEEFVGIIEAGV
ncbi:MAG TPA: UDP-N-acetylmuramoyl-tripeptide--D-alanyl-D-alanine ligase [Ignavibacteriaceae bacterium]|nr:UDP-N-acetylmuramoyl-tripeptide--D-alanyl-D-alanine ligase [Ignavibacteriaceae bacterium]